jgi:hypothetical protein
MAERHRRTELLNGFEETSGLLATVSADPGPLQYKRLVERIRDVVRALVPARTAVAVISKGDDALLELDGRKGWHFPSTPEGEYAGYHPANSRDAIRHLEELRDAGAEYLVLPSTSFWWLDYYKELARYLIEHYELRFQDERTCLIFGLAETATSPKLAPASSEEVRYTALVKEIRDLTRRVLPREARVAVITRGDPDLLDFNGLRGFHFPPADSDEYAGPLPADSEQPIQDLETMFERGAQYFLIPATEYWWLDYYSSFRRYLESGRHRLVLRQKHVCAIYELSPQPALERPQTQPSRFAEYLRPWRRS